MSTHSAHKMPAVPSASARDAHASPLSTATHTHNGHAEAAAAHHPAPPAGAAAGKKHAPASARQLTSPKESQQQPPTPTTSAVAAPDAAPTSENGASSGAAHDEPSDNTFVPAAVAAAAACEDPEAAHAAMIARKKASLHKYSYFEELNRESKLEAAERELMEVEDAQATAWRLELKQHMHLLAGGEMFFWNALGAAPSATPRAGARKQPSWSARHAEAGASNGAAEDAHLVAAACAHNAHLDKASPRGSRQQAPTRGHYLPVSIYGNHLGMLCIIVPRPDRRSMYNKLFFSIEQVNVAAAKVAEAKAERAKRHGETVEEPSPEPPPPEPQGLEDFETPPPMPEHLYDYVFESAKSVQKLVLTHQVASGKKVGHGHATAAAAAEAVAEAEANKIVDAVKMEGAAARALGGAAPAEDMDKNAVDHGLRLLLEGVDAFSTDPDIDQRATAELRARLDEYTPPEQRTRRNTLQFDSAEHMFEVHVAEGEHARAELDAQLDNTVAVVSKLEGLHEADSATLQDLYEHDILANNEKLAREVARDQKRREREAAKKAAGESTGGNRRKARVVKSGGVRSSGYGQ